jgi:hypothetical protein
MKLLIIAKLFFIRLLPLKCFFLCVRENDGEGVFATTIAQFLCICCVAALLHSIFDLFPLTINPLFLLAHNFSLKINLSAFIE